MTLPTIIITGASGFIGRNVLDCFKDEFIIYAMGRRSRQEADIPYHHNVQWIQCDIANWESLKEVLNYIKNNGGAQYIFHLAAFYDFDYKDHPEYERTNVLGTSNMLKFAKELNIDRFIFASSVAACNFPQKGGVIRENTPADADYPYARSKRLGENLLREYSVYFPCTSVRFAAVFSDWCEYAPLYKFLGGWLSKKFYSRFLAGRGESAVPYIHINDLCSLFKRIIQRSNLLPVLCTLIASPDGATSHNELYKIATRYYFAETVKPIYIPKYMTYPGLTFRRLLQRFNLLEKNTFEKYWMLRYINLQLNVDSSYTREKLSWAPTSRFHITRRLLFLLEKWKSHPDEWTLKNEAALKRVARRTNLLIYEYMAEHKDNILLMINNKILYYNQDEKFKRYKELNRYEFFCYTSTLYHLLMASVRSNDRKLILQYIDDIAIRRFAEGFLPNELCDTLTVFKDTIYEYLLSSKEIQNIKDDLYDFIGLTIQIGQDEIEDLYENLIKKIDVAKIADSPLMPDCEELQKMIRQLSAFYQITPENVR